VDLLAQCSYQRNGVDCFALGCKFKRSDDGVREIEVGECGLDRLDTVERRLGRIGFGADLGMFAFSLIYSSLLLFLLRLLKNHQANDLLSQGGIIYPWTSGTVILSFLFGVIGLLAFCLWTWYSPIPALINMRPYATLAGAATYLGVFLSGVISFAVAYFLVSLILPLSHRLPR
jgi:hypothetical protein